MDKLGLLYPISYETILTLHKFYKTIKKFDLKKFHTY